MTPCTEPSHAQPLWWSCLSADTFHWARVAVQPRQPCQHSAALACYLQSPSASPPRQVSAHCSRDDFHEPQSCVFIQQAAPTARVWDPHAACHILARTSGCGWKYAASSGPGSSRAWRAQHEPGGYPAEQRATSAAAAGRLAGRPTCMEPTAAAAAAGRTARAGRASQAASAAAREGPTQG